MAEETEQKRLDEERLQQGVRALLQDAYRGFFIVAEHSTSQGIKIVGQLMVTFEWSDWRNGVFWWIQSVYVDRPWRRQGIYRRLYNYVLEKARADATVCGIRLYVAHNNPVAQNVYQRVGLIPSGHIVYECDFVYAPHTEPSRSHPTTEAP
jgi:GNAT superfamily N-acetyltransferase